MEQSIFHQSDGPARRRARLEVRLAAQERAFALVFQPRLALRDGTLRAVEAQLRWKPRRGGIASTGALLPLLRECGQADDMEAWALREACRAALSWDTVPVALAVEGDSLRQGRLLGHVGEALTLTGLPANRLEIAISAAALDGDEDTLLAVAALRDAGVAVGLDAFGGDGACLLTLKRLPLTAVKLDRRLVRDLPDDRDAAALTRASIGFAQAMGLTTIATGLETAEQLAWLRQAGCDEAQGSLCGAAMAAGGAVPGLKASVLF